jgi:hypothetical protein
MNRRNFLLFGMAFMFALKAQQAQSSKLTVQVSYTGSGTVNESHKVYVVLWDTPDFVKTSELSQSLCNLPTSVGAWMLCHAMSCCN